MPGFDVDAARKAGYSEDEILAHLTESRKFDISGALQSGYSKQDLIQHLSTAPAPAAKTQEPRTFGDDAVDFLSKTWEAYKPHVNPIEMAKGVYTAAKDPLAALTGIGQAQADLAAKAKESFEKGDYLTGLRQSINYLIPVLGPGLERAGERFATGDIPGGVGETAGIATNVALPGVIGRVKGVRVTPRVVNPNPIEAEALAYVQREGVPVPAGTVTGSPFIKGAQKMSATTPGGAIIAERQAARTTEGLERLSGKLEQQTHPTPVVPEQAGVDLRSAITKRVETEAAQADQGYGMLRTAETNPSNVKTVQVGVKEEAGVKVPITEDMPFPVDVRDIKAQIKPIYEHMKQWWSPADRNASAGFQALRSILEGPDYVPASVAEAGLGGMKELGRTGKGRSQGLGKYITPKLQQAIDAAVSSDPNALAGLRAGRAATARQYTTQGVLDRLRLEPVEAFGQMTYRNDAGIELLRKVAKEAPAELPKIGRAWLQRAFERPTGAGPLEAAQGAWKNWTNLGPETKKLLFKNPLLIQNVEKFFLAARKIAENPNPSGSAILGSMGAQGFGLTLTDPITFAKFQLGGAAIAKLLHSPKGAKLLTDGLRIPLGKPAAARTVVAQILALAGRDAQRVEQPAQ